MDIRTKRAYEAPATEDGKRYLVDRLWPRGLKREALELAGWLKDVAPSTELRKWYGHEPERWETFRERYFQELDANPSGWQPLLEAAQHGRVTLVYSTKETVRNNAAALKEYLEQKIR